MHPSIRILLVLTIAWGVSGGAPADLVTGAGLLAALLAAEGRPGPGVLIRAALKMRYFYLSIAVLYLWFTPGEPLIPGAGRWSPTLGGALEGLDRVAVLVIIISAVQWLMVGTPRESLVAGLSWVLRPTRRLGAPVDRIAVRLVMAMHLVPRLRGLAAESRQRLADAPPVRRIAGVAAEIMAATISEAERAECPTLEVPRLPSPGVLQWVPLAVAAALFLWV